MPGRFRKTVKVAPGTKLNISKGTPSVSFEPFPGLSLNISERGLKGTIGIPGTGISYSLDHLEKGPKQ